jgi:adenylate cyclase
MFKPPAQTRNQQVTDAAESQALAHRRASVSRRLRRLQAGIVIGILVGLIVMLIILLGGLTDYESRLADLFYRPRAASGQVVLVLIDDKSVEYYGWPIERFSLAGFFFPLAIAQPRVVVLNLVLPDPLDEGEDRFLAAALQRSGRVVFPVLGIEATRFPPSDTLFPTFDSALRPAPVFRTPNISLGHAMIYPDADGIVRHVPLAIDALGVRYPAMGLTALALYQGVEPAVQVRDQSVIFGDQSVPIDDRGRIPLNFVGRDAIPRFSYADVAQGKVDLQLLRDKIVLVGPATRSLPLNYAVPPTVSDARMFNVEIQANLIETLIAGRFLREQDRLTLIVEALALALIAGITLPHLRWLYAAALSIGYFAAYIVYAFQRFDSGIITTPLYAALALVLTYGLTMFYRYLSEERYRALVGRAFFRMVPPETMHQVLTLYDRGALSLRGGRREVTVLCANLRSLSTLSETIAPETIIELMSRSTSAIFDVVFRHGGSIHSQSGNVIFAMWNFPLDQPDHARRAVLAAFEIQRAVAEISPASDERVAEVYLGVATGAAVAGYISSPAREDYSVIGDVVNIAERLSILASDNRVCLDATTRELLRDEFDTRLIHQIRVRGRKEPIQVWQVEEKITLKGIP